MNLERRSIVFTDHTKINWLKKHYVRFPVWNKIRKSWNVILNAGFQKKGYKAETLLFVGDLQKCCGNLGKKRTAKVEALLSARCGLKELFKNHLSAASTSSKPTAWGKQHPLAECYSYLNVRRKWKLEWGSRVQGQEQVSVSSRCALPRRRCLWND